MTTETGAGIYILYPRTDVFRRVHERPDTHINFRHTKVGLTAENFITSGREYRETFGNHFKFIPLVEIQDHLLPGLEEEILAAVASQYPRVGNTRNWFDTEDRASIIALIYKLLTPAANEPNVDQEGPVVKTG